MRTSSSVTVPAPVDRVVPFLVDLSEYPRWMPMIHSVARDDHDDVAWTVELRAKVGPFARSKRLRMARTSDSPVPGGRRIVFERRERSATQHSRWAMTVDVAGSAGSTTVTIDLEYGGSLWTAGVLDRVLAACIEDGKNGLVRAVTAGDD